MGSGIPHKLIEVQIQGGDQARANLANWWAKAPRETEQAFYQEMEETMLESHRECPYDELNGHHDGTPHLRDTARVGTDLQGDEIIIYGSYATPYAVYVHEILAYHHDWPTKAKFLEDPATRRARVLIENIKRRMAALFRDPISNIHTSSPETEYSMRKYGMGSALVQAAQQGIDYGNMVE